MNSGHTWAAHKVTCQIGHRKVPCVGVQPVSIAPSARKHGIADEDMLHAWRNQLGARYYDDGLTMVVGPDGAGNLLEVGIAETPDEGLVIIHTMQAQRKTLRGVLGR